MKYNFNESKMENREPIKIKTPSFRTINSQKELKDLQQRYDNELCNDKMTFQECELAILRQAVDESELINKKKLANSEEIENILKIVEEFLKKKKLICYGGTAINNILPEESQFYDRDIEIPDYDFYSPNALHDAIHLADIYYKKGYNDVEAKAGVHKGTFKVFVNFIPIADITQLHPKIFNTISQDAITIQGIKYSPPDFLRMNMYLELSRPMGDVSRWEKVMKRLTLLNKHYPMRPGVPCSRIEFQRNMKSIQEQGENLYQDILDNLVNQEVIFFGGYATSLFSRHINTTNSITKKVPDFDILNDNPEVCATLLKEHLSKIGYKNIEIKHHHELDEILSEHIEFCVNNESVLFIYKPLACHSYNKVTINGQKLKIATIDTILTMYLAFIYAGLQHYNKDRLLCMAKYLFDVEARNRLSNKGLLKRFSINCYGKQKTIEEIRMTKADQYKKLRTKRGTKEYDEWFLKYNPADIKTTKKYPRTMKKQRSKTASRTTTKTTKQYKMNNKQSDNKSSSLLY